jgi:cell division protein FtsB
MWYNAGGSEINPYFEYYGLAKRDQEKVRARRKQLKTALVVLLLALATAWAISPITTRVQQQKEIASLERQKKQVKRNNQQLRTNIKKLKADPTYWEVLARTNMGYIKGDEEAYVVIEKPGRPPHPSKPKDPPTLWQQIKLQVKKFSLIFYVPV